MQFDYNLIADIPFEEYPIMLTEAEWNRVQKMMGKPRCRHIWVARQARPDGDFVIVHDDSIERRALPRGRYCSKCHRVEFESESPDPQVSPQVWTQKDFMELGFQ